MGRLIAFAQAGGLPGFRPGPSEDLDVAGASSGEQVRFTYEGDDGVTYRGVCFVASDRDTARSVAVELVGTDLDETLVERVRASLELLPPDGPGGEPSVG